VNATALLLDAVAAPVALLDVSGRIMATNEAWVALGAPAVDQNCFETCSRAPRVSTRLAIASRRRRVPGRCA
jgi:hypothetical protein